MIAELHRLGCAVQCQQVDRFIHAVRQVSRCQLDLTGDRAGVREVHQRLHDTGYAPGLLENILGHVANFPGVGFILQILCQAGDTSDGVADFVGHACCEAADRGQALVMQ